MIRTRTRYFAAHLAAGCLLGAMTVAVIAPASRARVIPRSCSNIHVNVEGYDAGQGTSGISFGDEAQIWVNGPDVINNLHAEINRSIFVADNVNPSGNFVEVGWGAGGSYPSFPTAYAEWVNNGIDSTPQFYTGYTLSEGASYHFTVENVGDIGIWRFYVDSQSTPFNYSPTMNFNYGWPLTNSERRNSCDSMWTHMYGINWLHATSWQSYENLTCYSQNSGDYFFQKVSNSEEYVQTINYGCP